MLNTLFQELANLRWSGYVSFVREKLMDLLQLSSPGTSNRSCEFIASVVTDSFTGLALNHASCKTKALQSLQKISAKCA